jgi:putative hemolysin
MFSLFSSSGYKVRITREMAAVEQAQRLRYEVFNLELGEGLAGSHERGVDADAFDVHCDHLVIEEPLSGGVVGTYRLQTGIMAAHGIGFYSAQEFDFSPYEPHRDRILELGRACIHKDHRKRAVLDLLWRGIVAYASEHQSQFLLGCSSLTSQDPADGWGLYQQLRGTHLAPEGLRTEPLMAYRLPEPGTVVRSIKAPKLFATYLSVGAVIAGPPALDRAFRTIDFLTILDLAKTSLAGKRHFLKEHD